MYILNEMELKIKNNINEILKKHNVKFEVNLEKPLDSTMGDFSLPCFQFSKIFKKPPEEIANIIKSEIKKEKIIKKIKGKNGYLNFFLDEKIIIQKTLENILKNMEKYGYHTKKNKKIIIEHTSANPNGPLHVGRARNPIIGDTLVRLGKASGYNIISQFYLDDMGKQVAILYWGLKNLDPDQVLKSNRKKPDHESVAYYQKSVELMNKNEKNSNEIQNIVKKSEKGDKKTLEEIKKAYEPVLKGINESLKFINITLDHYIPESNFIKDKSVDAVIIKLNNSKYSKKEDKARYIEMENFGIKGRNTKFYYLRKDGTTLYATRDIAYHIWKAKNSDIMINILGEDHRLESKQVEIALKIFGEKKIPKIVFYSFVSLPEGKMSTRKARVVYLDDLIDEAIDRAYKEVKKRRGNELSEKKMKEISKIVGTGSIRFNIIKVQPEKSITFKWEEALNFEGNSAPFIQYAYARSCSILSKAKNLNIKINPDFIKENSETNLVRKFAEYPNIIIKSFEESKPHLLANYLLEFSSVFNQFYRDCPVLSINNQDIKKSRLFLVKATKTILKNGLNLLGINAPDEM